MHVWSHTASRLNAFVAIVLGGVLLLFEVAIGLDPIWWVVGPLLGGLWYPLSMRRYFRRRKLLSEPFPQEWRDLLRRRILFYRRLDEEGRQRFERNVRIFLAEQRIFGEAGRPAPEDIKLLIAASAAMLCHGKPNWEWPTMRDIVVYPGAFDETSYQVGSDAPIIGMVQSQGAIIFSAPHLREGFRRKKDGKNVGLHELAHVMDMADGAADGVPGDLDWKVEAPWVEDIHKHLEAEHGDRLRRVLGNYAYTNEAEFFAVAVEEFFERPAKVREADKELFELLEEYFNLDPFTGRILQKKDESTKAADGEEEIR